MPNAKKARRLRKTTYLASWNIQGRLTDQATREQLEEDMNEREIAIAGLQETGWKTTAAIKTLKGGTIHSVGSEDRDNRGLGFYVNQYWQERLVSIKSETPRIAVARFKANDPTRKKGDMSVINVYGPTQMRTINRPEEAEAFYEDIRRIYEKERRGTELIFVLGDFNSKIGRQESETDEEFMGKYGKGERNANGEVLKDFLSANNLYLLNTHFKHKDHHIATWHGGQPSRRNRLKRIHEGAGLHNQIDYIVTPKRNLKLVTNARSYTCMATRSDHSMVVASIQLSALYKLAPVKRNQQRPRDLRLLATNSELRTDYENVVSGALTSNSTEENLTARYEQIKKILTESAAETLPVAPRKEQGKIRLFDDSTMRDLSKQQRKLTKALYKLKGKKTRTRRQRIKTERNRIFKKLKERQRILKENHMQKIATELEENKGNSTAFEFARIMSKNTTTLFSLEDEDTAELFDKQQRHDAVFNWYKSFFNREDAEALDPWRGEARALATPINTEEIQEAASRLRNRRALGPDAIAGELIKYGGNTLHEIIANMINNIFERHETISEIKEGYLYPLNKSGKKRIASNTRPLVFLTTIRKIFSTLVLRRIMVKVDEYLSLSQHAYRAKRSTTESVWTTQWLHAMSERYQERIHISGIDLSKAFDCLDRKKLIDILIQYNLCTEDEIRMITYLLAETKIQIKIGQDIGEKFSTTIGTPQGDALSPILFLIYMEHIMRTFPTREYMTAREITFAYADDINFAYIDTDMNRTARHRDEELFRVQEGCECAACRSHRMEPKLEEHMRNYNMNMNVDKTEHHELIPGRKTTLTILKSNIDREKELKYRKSQAANSFNAMHKIWLRGTPITTETKIRLYNSCVKSRLLYNAGATTYTQVQMDQLDAFHRSQLRRLLGIYYPRHIGNRELYEQTKTEPISIEVLRLRWTALGHNLRLPKETPANRAMIQHFQRRTNNSEVIRKATRRGRLLTTIPRLLDKELKFLSDQARIDHFNISTLTTSHDLEILRLKAQNRVNWMKGVEAVTSAYKQNWTKREEKKPHRYNPDYQQEARGGGGRRGRERRGRGRGRPPSRALLPRGQQTITAYLRK